MITVHLDDGRAMRGDVNGAGDAVIIGVPCPLDCENYRKGPAAVSRCCLVQGAGIESIAVGSRVFRTAAITVCCATRVGAIEVAIDPSLYMAAP